MLRVISLLPFQISQIESFNGLNLKGGYDVFCFGTIGVVFGSTDPNPSHGLG